MYRTRTTIAAAIGSAILMISPAAADIPANADLPVTHVTLYTSGVGYFERTGWVDGDSTETLLFPVDQVNDILKSMVLLDHGGGSIEPVTYAAQDPLAKQLSGFSIDLSDNPSRATLLNRLRGAGATVTTATETITGTIVGVETKTVTLPANGGTTSEDVLNLLTSAGALRSIGLADVTNVMLTDPALNQELKAALTVVAQGRDVDKRPVKLSFSGHGRRSVTVGYLTAAPLWQTTYRLVLGRTPMIQGWALVQNTSQDDWNRVSLSLVSGRPISFTQNLYTPVYVPRPAVQAQVAQGAAPQSYATDMLTESAPTSVASPPVIAPALPAPSGSYFKAGAAGITTVDASTVDGAMPIYRLDARAALKSAVETSGAKLGSTLFNYQIKVPVTVPRQQSAMIPFVSSGIDAEEVSIYNHGVQADHPLAGARLKNNTGLHLMGGPMTVFDDTAGGTSYVGDALIDDTEPGQTRLISYAVDLPVDAETDADDAQSSRRLVVDRGTLVVTNRMIYKTTYTFKNNSDDSRKVVVEHPYRGDDYKLLEPAKADEHTAEYDRFDLNVPAKSAKSLVVKQEHRESTEYGVLNVDIGTLVSYCNDGDIDPQVKSALEDVIRRRQHVAEIQSEIDGKNAALDSVSEGQDRIRNNMKALDHASALYKRYVGELDAQETRIEGLHADVDRLTRERDAAQADLSNGVAKLSAE